MEVPVYDLEGHQHSHAPATLPQTHNLKINKINLKSGFIAGFYF